MSNWTDDRVSLLKQLWGEGKTAAEIAKALGEGVTRNAVIGKAHRLKLSTRVSPIQQNTKKPKIEVQKVKPQKPKVDVKFKGKGVKLEALKDRMCRWPIGDPQDENFVFCGCEAVPGLPYCAEHAKVAYQISTRSRNLQAEDFPEDAGAPQDFDIKHAVGT